MALVVWLALAWLTTTTQKTLQTHPRIRRTYLGRIIYTGNHRAYAPA